MHQVCKHMQAYILYNKKYEEIGQCMIYANTSIYMHYVSTYMHKYANYMMQICNHMQVTSTYMHFCIDMQFYGWVPSTIV